MSLSTKFISLFTSSRTKRGGIAALGMSGALVAVLTLIPASGAWFTDTKQSDITVTTGTFGMTLSNTNGTLANGNIQISLAGFRPGDGRNEYYTVKNTGTTPGTVSVVSNGVAMSGGAGTYDASKLHFYIDGVDVPVAGQSPARSIATLAAGQSKEFAISTTLDNTAGNEWQGITAKTTLSVTMNQDNQ